MTLPQFCLSYIQSRWIWLGFKPPLPSRNEHFSLVRVFVLTAGQAFVGVILGLVLSLLLYHRPVSWLMWLLGSFTACQGIVGYGFTALCWNQRAARLLANPSLDINLKPARFVMVRWFLGLIYFLILALITPAAILLTIENIRGEILWKRERAKLIAQGERLEFRDILGPTIPPEQNAGAAPLFAPFFDYQYDEQGHAVWRDTNALFRVEERIKFPDNYAPERSTDATNTPAVNLAAWADAYREVVSSSSKNNPSWAAELKLPTATNNPAQVVLAGLSVASNELSQLCEASARPRVQFPVHYDEAFNALLRHIGSFKAVQLALERRCAAHLALGEIAAAFEDAQCSLRIAELLREEPLLISQLVRYAQGALAIATVWQGLAEHRWTEEQLATFQNEFARMDYLPGIALSFEGERAGGILAVDSWIAGRKSISSMVGPTESGSPAQFPGVGTSFSRGMLRQNEIALARYHNQMIAIIRTAISNAPQMGLAATAKAALGRATAEETALMKKYSPYTILAGMLAPATGSAVNKAARAQTVAKMAMVACALERYHLKHGSFPEKLDDLVPAFFPAPPLDPMNNQLFRYRRTDDGWFQLYSVGLNGQDDGGVFRARKTDVQEDPQTVKKSKGKSDELDWPWPVPSRPERYRIF